MTTLEMMNNLLGEVRKLTSQFPHERTYISTLGGESNASILVTIGLDKKETWKNGIFENSRYVKYSIDRNRKGIELECFQFCLNDKTMKKFRRVTGTPEKIIERLTKDIKVLESII